MQTHLTRVRGIAAVLAAGWLGVCGNSLVESKEGPMGQAAESYKQYTGTEPALLVSLEYPAAWLFREERGKVELYREVSILGPRNSDDTYACYLAVRGSPVKRYGGRFEDLDEMVKHYTDHLLTGAQVLGQQDIVVGGLPAKDMTVTYVMPPWHHKGIKAAKVPVKTRNVFIAKPPYLYELVYSADAREYDRHAPAFEQLIKTFQIQ